MKKLKLTNLESDNLSQKEMNNLKGGENVVCPAACLVLEGEDEDYDASEESSKRGGPLTPIKPIPFPPREER
ncbi:MAG: TIGR04149 family rSAM-modified RiPP [Bacteroidales bacterium]|jgi:natural product precursor|nr:TIGR04149 family rSAM-modified RiPP [Bacteroidales bacterium]